MNGRQGDAWSDDEGKVTFGLEGGDAKPASEASVSRRVTGVRLSQVSVVERGQWNNRWDYIMVLLGYAIGIGNLWRFPYLVGRYGGGAFVLAYLVCLVIVAAPLFLMELVWGQASQKNTMGCLASIHPRWLGLGVSSALLIVIVSAYYNILLAYCCIYLVSSFQDPLPWTVYQKEGDIAYGTPAEAYWYRVVLDRFDPDELTNETAPGRVLWPLATALFVVYVLIWIALCKGHESLAGAAKVMVIVPVALLCLLVGRTLFMEGMEDGLQFYLGKFDVDQLRSGEMWASACGQILFSLSPGMGTAITMSSFTSPTENVYKINLIVVVANSAFSLFGAVAVFGILGNLSRESCKGGDTICKSVEELASESGTGLAFISIADGLGSFGKGWSQAIAVPFFLMLLCLGLDSSFAWIETINTYINDYLVSRGNRPKKHVTAFFTCAALFLCGLPFCTRLGNPLLDVVDHYPTTYALLTIVFFEMVALNLDYSVARLSGDLHNACGRHIPKLWQFFLKFASPVIVPTLTIFLLVDDVKTPYEGYPMSLNGIGWFLFLLPVSAIPVGVIRAWYYDLTPDDEPKMLSPVDPYGTFEEQQRNPLKQEVI